MDAARGQAGTGGWIGGPGFDLCFFFGGGVLAMALGVFALTVPAAVVPLWLLWLWLVEGPHLVATWQRTYFDPQVRRERAGLMWKSLLWMLPGPVMLLASWLLERPEPFLLLLAFAFFWSFHHGVRQHYGVLAIYQRLGAASESARRWDSRLLYGCMWGALALFLLAHPVNRPMLGLPAEAGATDRLVMAVLLSLLVLALAGWALALVQRWRRGAPVKPGLFALTVPVGVTLFTFFVVGLREPLLPYLVTPEQMFMAATVVGGTLHGVQYLGIVIAASARAKPSDGASLAARMGRAPLFAYVFMVALSLLYLGLNFLRGASPLGSPVAPDSDIAQIFLALYWGLFFHHYWLDQKIWRPSKDARLRAELGLGGA